MITLRVNDIKQYVYCPRVVFYQYSMPVEKKTTWKMDQGKIEEAEIDRLEQRRKLTGYRLAEGGRRFHFSADFDAPGPCRQAGFAYRQSGGTLPGGF